MRTSFNLQETLLEKILHAFPKKSDAVEALVELLSISRDGIYRRLRSDTALTTEEIVLLARHFGISIDELISNDTNKILFSYNLYDQQITSFTQYLEQVYSSVSEFKQGSNLQVYYASREIPVFIFMMFPKLLNFKLYLYGLTAWHFDYLQQQKFNFDLLLPRELEMAQATSQIYCQVDSTDLWTVTILEQTLNQIEYLAMESRFDKPEDAYAICDEVEAVVKHARSMAEAGVKFLPGRSTASGTGAFNLFYNELASTNNTILVFSEYKQALFETFASPNFLYTTDQRLCDSMKNWFDETLNHSTSISVYSGKSRNYYFNRLEKKVGETMKHLELIYSQL